MSVATHTRTSLAHWNPSRVGLASQTRTCMGPLTEMSTRNILGGEGRPARRADNLAAIYEPIVEKMWERQHLTALWAFAACCRDTFTLLYV
jgi:hypothetical protein